MHKITQDRLRSLIDQSESSPAITIYMPTHRVTTPPSMSEDQLRFKNLYNRALGILKTTDNHNDLIKAFTSKCESLLEDRAFWENMSESILICARNNLFEYYHLPIDSEEYVSVADHFHLVPIISLLNELVDYNLLLLSKQDPKFLSGDAYGLVESKVQLPRDLKSALNIDEMHQKSLQFASVDSSSGAMYHGHGAGKDNGNHELLKFFRLIDSTINENANTDLPLIIAGVQNETAAYDVISHHPQILRGHIDGHYTIRDIPMLHEKASEIIQNEIIQASHAAALESYQVLYGKEQLTSERLADIKDAAENGRVKTLIVNMSRETRDTVRDTMNKVRKLVFPKANESNTVDYIASLVFSQGGQIINLSDDEMPKPKLMLAINRY